MNLNHLAKIIEDSDQAGHDEQTARILENMTEARQTHGDIYAMSFDEFEEMFEDRDPFEFL
jgi:hypothetical protein